MNTRSYPIVYIVIVNWNSWQDTLICLESIFRLHYPSFKVIVCDNASTDNSLSYIMDWAEGNVDVCTSPLFPLRKHLFPPVQKPIQIKFYKSSELGDYREIQQDDARLIVMETIKNIGYAGGNNMGLQYAHLRDDCDYIWILNNDTIADPDALTKMVSRMKNVHNAGMCGSTLLYYDNPHIVQTYGGATYNKWFGYSRFIGAFNDSNKHVDADYIESQMDYIVGASVLVSRKVIDHIGLIPEEYFIYSEDLEWSVRAKKHYKLVYASESIIYHKEGKSSGAGSSPAQKGLLSDYYFLRSRLLFTRKIYPYALPTVYLGFIASLINRLKRKQYNRIGLIFRLLLTCGRVKTHNEFIGNDKHNAD